MSTAFKNMFDEFHLINLDNRPDRLEQSMKELEKLGIEDKVERFPAIQNDEGWRGCLASHFQILRFATYRNHSAFIFEDDVEFIHDFRTTIEEASKELKDIKFDMFYLGGNICNTITQISPHLGKLSHAQSTHAYGISIDNINKILNIVNENQNKVLDLIYSENIIPYMKCYITIPMACAQRDGYSNIENKEVNYSSWMEKRFYEQLHRNS
jgi:GR25 family glycosyltransferase involved in LPS biosynthesis